MNNELFDRMIKDNLQEVQVAPSAGVKKALAWKLFFQNMLVFHKAKLIIGVLLMSTASTFYFADFTGASNEAALPGQIAELLDKEESKQFVELIAEEEIIEEKNIESVVENEGNSTTDIKQNSVETEINESTNSTEEIESNEIAADLEKGEASVEKENQSPINESVVDLEETQENEAYVSNEEESQITDKQVEKKVTSEIVAGEEENKVIEELFLAESKGIALDAGDLLVTPIEVEEFKMEKPNLTFHEISFDVYKGLMGQSELTSSLHNVIRDQYYWDFYGANDVLQANVLGGANINYTFGSRMFRLKANAGLSYYTINDTKANYEFNEITDPAWLDFFDTDELAWVDTYGVDTCTQCFYAQNSEELQSELEQEHNRYSYVKVPLQLGAQFNFKYVSLDVLGGMDMNILTKSKGIYVKEGLNPDYERFYYWDNMQLSTLSKGNEMLKKSFMTWSLAANVRVRVSKNFDLLAGYQINKSIGSITDDNYMMDKTLKSSNATVGITFYPSRMALKPKF